MTAYFDIDADMSGRHWYLDDVAAFARQDWVELEALSEGRRYDGPTPLVTRIVGPGLAADFSLAGAGVPVVTERAGSVLARFLPSTAVQRLEGRIKARSTSVEIWNVLDVVDAIDWERSRYELFDENGENPNIVGHVSMMERLVLRADAVRSRHLFRLHRCTLTLVMSRELREALEAECELAVEFMPVFEPSEGRTGRARS